MTGILHWINQVASVAYFNLCTIPARIGAAMTAGVGIAGVVAVLVGVLAISAGFRRTMTIAGVPDVAVVLRAGADSEMTSGLSRDEARLLHDMPGVARDAQGPLVSAELFVVIDLPKRTTGTDANVPMRGVEAPAFDLRGNVKMVSGRRFESGKNEIIAGVGAAREFAGLDVGQSLKIGQNTWKVVGIFSAGGGVAESEIWTDAGVLQPAYQRDGYQSVYAKLVSPESFQEFKDAATSNPQLTAKVMRLSEFYADQSTFLTEFINTIGIGIAALMALGALFGALNTMYSAVAGRTREIATLRALGFGASPVVLSVLIESVVVALAGGLIGALGAYLVFDGYRAATFNFQTFTQVTFAFAVTPELLGQAILWAIGLGLIGGLFPAIRAARLPIASGLRES